MVGLVSLGAVDIDVRQIILEKTTEKRGWQMKRSIVYMIFIGVVSLGIGFALGRSMLFTQVKADAAHASAVYRNVELQNFITNLDERHRLYADIEDYKRRIGNPSGEEHAYMAAYIQI